MMNELLKNHTIEEVSIGLATVKKIKNELGVEISVEDAIASYNRLDKYDQQIQYKSLQDNGYFS